MHAPEQDDTSKFGRWMLWAAWALIFALLVYFFSGFIERKYNPNQNPSSTVSGGTVEVHLKQNSIGHYVTTGFINGEPVTFLLDTGATTVTIGAHLANKLGLKAGQRFQAQTANGVVTVARTQVRELRVGEIRLYNVEANLNPGMNQDEILLGMSALRQLELVQRGDTLLLRSF
ncbi:retropepsin-like aspartic protease family protein [Agaribacter flavus]|uniref:TIGR02281 family clan AA aspartic protease n=1 Tax=Agaribacter flavus TaxID=1902781 RepID=A0ABV7FX37_9ALTE